MYTLIPTGSHQAAYLFRDREQAILSMKGALEMDNKNHWFMSDRKQAVHIGVEAENRNELITKIQEISKAFKTVGEMPLLDRRRMYTTNFPLVCTYKISKDYTVKLV